MWPSRAAEKAHLPAIRPWPRNEPKRDKNTRRESGVERYFPDVTRIRKDFYKFKIRSVLPASLNAKEYVIKEEDFISSTLRTQRKEKLTQT